jgi:hypothetical protein
MIIENTRDFSVYKINAVSSHEVYALVGCIYKKYGKMPSNHDVEIKPIGTFLQTNAEGFIVNTTSLEQIQDEWLPAVEKVTDAYRKHFGTDLHSVYIRGSVAKGQAIHNVSDIDSFAVVTLSRE